MAELKNVDALTFGLSTLCLGSAFANAARRVRNPSGRPFDMFAGNDYAKYTRKFSLGNGPSDWVADYGISEENGKMLGTLVAIAIAKMKNLEAFNWDMASGVLSDVFMALASLAGQPGTECKLRRVWIRWHRNTHVHGRSSATHTAGSAINTTFGPDATPVSQIGILWSAQDSQSRPRAPVPYADYHCEYPTFSVLPPLKSLTVLDIDELSYLDELAVLIERSKDSLQELRLGSAAHAAQRLFIHPWDGPQLQQIDHSAQWPGESSLGERRLGGMLGVVVGKIFDIQRKKSQDTTQAPSANGPASPPLPGAPAPVPEAVPGAEKGGGSNKSSPKGREKLVGKLKLQTLELERVPLSMEICVHAFDWAMLSSLTLLDCLHHRKLWKTLKRHFRPTPLRSHYATSLGHQHSSDKPALQYHLALRHIHTNQPSDALIQFIEETLAPNSLEVFFLQCRVSALREQPPVILETIFKGVIKKHRSSLQKVLLDSTNLESLVDDAVADPYSQLWALDPPSLLYLTSGRMTSLRELSVSLPVGGWVRRDLLILVFFGMGLLRHDHRLTWQTAYLCPEASQNLASSRDPYTPQHGQRLIPSAGAGTPDRQRHHTSTGDTALLHWHRHHVL